MNITGYTLPRTLKPDFIVLIRIVYDQYQCSSGYRDSSTYLGWHCAFWPPSHTKCNSFLFVCGFGLVLPLLKNLLLTILKWFCLGGQSYWAKTQPIFKKTIHCLIPKAIIYLNCFGCFLFMLLGTWWSGLITLNYQANKKLGQFYMNYNLYTHVL